MCKNANIVEKPAEKAIDSLAARFQGLYIYTMLDTLPIDGSTVHSTAEMPHVLLPGSLSSGVLLLCDHAGNAFPPGYGTLGMSAAQLERHIAYDPGAAGITRRMAQILGAPAVLTRYSRLLIDPNRGEDDPTLVMRISDGAIIPGNAGMTRAEIARRIELYYRPYHRAVSQVIDAMIAAGKPPLIFSIHSFTENWRGWMRPWHAGVLWDKDPRLAIPLINALREDPEMVIGDNEPYAGALGGDSIHTHATMRGIANALIEVRQDLIRNEDGQAEWAEKLSQILRRLLVKPHAAATFHTIRQYGSHTGGPKTANGANGQGNGASGPDISKIASELEAAVFRRLVAHFRDRTDAQNIDLMNLAGFCRNCLANWLQEAAQEKGVTLTKDEARELIYGMPYEDWKTHFQIEATPDQIARFAVSRA